MLAWAKSKTLSPKQPVQKMAEGLVQAVKQGLNLKFQY
jgi:hypothetical protein